MTKQDYYKVLGVERNATERDIKMAFKKLARQYHPDVAENKEEAEVKFREINEAYAVLSDEEKRQLYDQFGHQGVQGSGGGYGGGYGGFSGGFGGFESIFESLFDMSGMGRASGQTRSRARRGSDLRKDVEIELEDAFRGKEEDFTVESYQTCPVCNGRRVKPGAGFKECKPCQGSGMMRNVQNTVFGQFVTSSTCGHCHGEGRIPEEVCDECRGEARTIRKERISVKIPAGIDNGMPIRLTGKGEAGEFGGQAGDLYLFVHVKEHQHLKREGKNLILELPIGFADAALGTEKEIVTFDGTEKIKIHEGTQTDAVLTLHGKGMPDLRGGKPGDLLVRLKVVTPTKLNEKQRKLLCQFAEEGPQFHCGKKGFFGKLVDALTGKN
ncbi:MAG: molecular chaperone DnaJ [Firmicutes bacterium]|nr:molecular chaperone DnaJ [Bacillota bacterium]